MARKCILSCMLSCILASNLHASGLEGHIPQAAQAIVAGVAVAVGVATKIIRPVDPAKDLPEIIIQDQPEAAPQKSIPQQTAELHKQSILDALSKPDAPDKQISQKAPLEKTSPTSSQSDTKSTPVISHEQSPPVEIQPQQISSPNVSATKAALHAAQKLHHQKQTVETKPAPTKQSSTHQVIQQNIPTPQKQISQQVSRLPQQAPVAFEWESSDDSDVLEEPHCSFSQLYVKKKSAPSDYTQKLLYERSVHFYFERIKNSSLLKHDPVYKKLTMSRKDFSVTDKETLLLRHESLIHGLHEAHQEIMLFQDQDGQSSNQTSESYQDKNTPKFDPEDPKDKKSPLLEVAEKITASIFELLKKKFPQFFRDGYGVWNKVKIASVSPAMQKVAEFLNIEKDELDIHIRHIFEPIIKLTKDGLYTINGFHHDINNVIEKSGNLIRLLDKRIDAQGFYKATIEIVSNNATKFTEKSFFPAHWSPEQVMQEIHYAMKNMELIRQELPSNFAIIQNIPKYLTNLPQSEPIIKFLGHTTDKISIMLVFDINKFAYVSAFPILGK